MRKRKKVVGLSLILIGVVAIGFIGLYSVFRNNTTHNLQQNVKYSNPKLDSQLNQLLQSGNYDQFAQSSGMQIKDGKVLVEITAVDDQYHLPPKFGSEKNRYNNLIDADVEINLLDELSKDSQIRSIQYPTPPVAQ